MPRQSDGIASRSFRQLHPAGRKKCNGSRRAKRFTALLPSCSTREHVDGPFRLLRRGNVTHREESHFAGRALRALSVITSATLRRHGIAS